MFSRLCLTIVFATAAISSASAASAKPNVLLICVDDLRPAIGAFGDPHAKTPNIDRLAARGTAFQRAYVQYPVCAPSRIALLSGFRPDELGIYELSTPMRSARPDVVALPQAFKLAGWHTESIGKIYHTAHGNIDDALSWSVASWTPKGGPRPDARTRSSEAAGSRGKNGPAWYRPDVRDDACADGQIGERGAERIAALAAAGQPFFLAVGFHKPHLPFIAPKRYWDLYDPATLPVHPVDAVPPAGAPSWSRRGLGEVHSYRSSADPFTPAEARDLVHGYYACVSFVDAQVGRLLDALDRSPAAKNTLIVFWGDHGFHLGDHGSWSKHTLFEPAPRAPPLVSAPGFRPRSTAALAATIDLSPTLCEPAGLAAPAGRSGRSLVPVMRDDGATTRDHVITVMRRPREGGALLGRALRTDRHRYVEWRKLDAARTLVAEELYDLEADPAESHNLAGQSAHAKLQSILTARIAGLGRAADPVGKAE